ncbi:FAD dependent oxidoreductase [Phenylobacterium zucineum HLK1]|uniref:FAD dependent oxidoreductase n=1 Tax=Phenylobacterium zucineum (strain HLK1) TaxID=450851 RepID=B4RFX0_PHEZH|nr:FAD-dependent oxidoreductase [Phenylobacterium zucineum]ACG78783.1 FAD dependent oxidoreductase [Phenylobacterium zucineum HLK1]
MSAKADVLVIGGGLHGLSAALQIARRGARVTLLERRRVGRHSSGASAAGVRTLGRARAELPLSLAAMTMWHGIAEIVGDDCGFHAHGQLQVAETEAELERIRARVDHLRRDGFYNEELVDAAQLRELVPGLARHCIGGAFAKDDGAADPHRTLAAYLRAATEAGVVVCEGTGVTQLERRDGVWRIGAGPAWFEAPLVVNAAGAWAGEIAAMAGDHIPLDTKASMMIVTERIAPFVRPTVSTAGRKLSFKQTDQGTLLIGGGQQGRADLANETAEVDIRTLARSAAAAVALFPSVAGLRIVRSWAGLEARTSDDIAIAGLSPTAPGLLHLFGFCGHGFQLVPALGVAAADLMLTGQTAFDLNGLQPGRLMTAGKLNRRSTRDGEARAPLAASDD